MTDFRFVRHEEIDAVSSTTHHPMSCPCTPAKFLAAFLALALSSAAFAGDPTLQPGFFEHRGYEQIVAGPDVPDSLGLTTTPDYTAFDVAINADGSRIWFTLLNLFNPPELPENEIWTMLPNGTGDLRIVATNDNWFEGRNLWIETSASGDVAALSSREKFSVVDLADPIPTAELVLEMDPSGFSNEHFRLTNDGSTVVFADTRNQRVGKFPVITPGLLSVPTIVTGTAQLSLDGVEPRTFRGFDLAGSTGDWWVFGENFFGAPFDRSRKWLNRGAGLLSPVISHETLPFVDQLFAEDIEVSDDGEILVYCLNASAALNDPQKCWVQEAGSVVFQVVEDGDFGIGRPVLADGGGVFYVLSNHSTYGFRVNTKNPQQRLVAGSQRLSGRPFPEFSNARLSDDGRILAAPTPLGVYVQHDGFSGPPGFPTLDSVASGYDADADELVVQVSTSLPSADFERIYTLPLFRGIEPSRSLDEAQNPLHSDRNGGGVNASTTFEHLGGGLWERRISLDSKLPLLTSEFALRIVAVDASGTRTTYSDFTPTMLFGDGFESGDLSAWAP